MFGLEKIMNSDSDFKVWSDHKEFKIRPLLEKGISFGIIKDRQNIRNYNSLQERLSKLSSEQFEELFEIEVKISKSNTKYCILKPKDKYRNLIYLK
jgi:hypothetical protein